MILGTVQLGMNYGINNSVGKLPREAVFRIFDLAYENGIRTLDTGPMYGEAEELIGSYFRERGERFVLSTKLPDSLPNEEAVSFEELRGTVQASLDRLNVNKVFCYYLHQFYQCRNTKIMGGLDRCRSEGMLEHVGISVYHPEELIHICRELSGVVDVVQIPYNIFSLSLWDEALELAKESGIRIFARSIYLQGLVFKDESDAFVSSIGAGRYIAYVRELAKKRGRRIDQLCYDAVSSEKRIEDFLMGSETEEQLLKNISMQKECIPLTKEEMKELKEYMKELPVDIIDPTQWGKYTA